MKTEYTPVDFKVFEFEAEDVITNSTDIGGGTGGNGGSN